ncbi:hypothetical protein FOC84_13455 [Achromobacter pestifer]|uniref:Uncharacterized protein n=1 Tax=Achromobacter pestifer TaxID=1353889 RepID=A0A7D4HTC0_9BURK|nr:hypothetical protein [Achromobacter pestifer]QKH35893.1 hypothetical protein FOC84_13455 [Achromobacter pestifer]
MKTSTIASIKAQKGAHACPHTLEYRIEPVLPILSAVLLRTCRIKRSAS